MQITSIRKKLGALIVGCAAITISATAVQAQDKQQRDTTDTTHWGQPVDTQAQNPPGYRGMERPVNVFPLDSAADSVGAAAVEGKVTGVYQDSTWQDTSDTARQNPPGYRGMERPVSDSVADSLRKHAKDSAAQDSVAADTGKKEMKDCP